jgi:hypothetical protein
MNLFTIPQEPSGPDRREVAQLLFPKLYSHYNSTHPVPKLVKWDIDAQQGNSQRWLTLGRIVKKWAEVHNQCLSHSIDVNRERFAALDHS